MPAEKLSVTLSPDVVASIDERQAAGRTNRSGVIDRDLARYYETLKAARHQLRVLFNDAELSALLDNLNGVWLAESIGLRLIPLNVVDASAELARKWEIDAIALTNKVSNLHHVHLCALADAAERYWSAVRDGKDPDPARALS